MNLLLTKGTYSRGAGRLRVSPDLKDIRATSYDWWQFIATDKVGNVFHIATHYSPSTSRHQSDALDVLRRLGIEVAFTFRHLSQNANFSSWEGSIDNLLMKEVAGMQNAIREHIRDIRNPRSRPHKNAQRRDLIRELWYRIKDVRRIQREYLDAKVVPVKNRQYEYRSHDAAESAFTPFFRKPNGKLNTNGLRAFIKRHYRYGMAGDAPRSIDRTRKLLGLKARDSVEFILGYRYARDTEAMIPSEDSPEYTRLQKWLARNIGESHPRNMLLMDKLHTYLINRLNRANRAPSSPRVAMQLPVHPAIRAAREILQMQEKAEALQIIDTDAALRAEGRKQHHCIGGSDYLQMCRKGYQALNFKGYTFFLTPDLRVDQTHGKYNSHTPAYVVAELTALLNRSAQAAPLALAA